MLDVVDVFRDVELHDTKHVEEVTKQSLLLNVVKRRLGSSFKEGQHHGCHGVNLVD